MVQDMQNPGLYKYDIYILYRPVLGTCLPTSLPPDLFSSHTRSCRTTTLPQ